MTVAGLAASSVAETAGSMVVMLGWKMGTFSVVKKVEGMAE